MEVQNQIRVKSEVLTEKSNQMEGGVKVLDLRVLKSKVKGSKKKVIKAKSRMICELCKFDVYTTTRQGNLTRHIKSMHSKVDLECCGINFPEKSLYYAHNKRSHPNSQFPCSTCNRSFQRKILLDRHSMVHTKLRPYKCDFCNYASSHKSNKDRHVSSVHFPRPTSAGSSETLPAPRRRSSSFTTVVPSPGGIFSSSPPIFWNTTEAEDQKIEKLTPGFTMHSIDNILGSAGTTMTSSFPFLSYPGTPNYNNSGFPLLHRPQPIRLVPNSHDSTDFFRIHTCQNDFYPNFTPNMFIPFCTDPRCTRPNYSMY